MISRFVTTGALTFFLIFVCFGWFQHCWAETGVYEIDGKIYEIKNGADFSNLILRNVRVIFPGGGGFDMAGATNFLAREGNNRPASAVFSEFRHVGYWRRDIINVKFDNSDLRGAIFASTVIANCSFRDANLSNLKDPESVFGTDLDRMYAIFRDCDFTNANIDGAFLVGLTGENFRSTATYRRAQKTKNLVFEGGSPLILKDPNLEQGKVGYGLDGTSFKDFEIRNVVFDMRLKNCDFSGAYLENVVVVASDDSRKMWLSTKNFQSGVFIGIGSFDGFPSPSVVVTGGGIHGNFTDVDFSSMRFTNCIISGDLTNANFTDSVFTNSSIWGKNFTIEQVKSTWNYKHGRMEGMPEEIQQALDAEKEQ